MKVSRHVVRLSGTVFLGLGFIWACGFDNTLREYLDAHFWLPFSKHPRSFARKDVRRISVPYAGMTKAQEATSISILRGAYQQIARPMTEVSEIATLRQAVAAARADKSLTRREREEVELIDAKIDMRAGQPDEPSLLNSAKGKLQKFLRTARTPEFLSEARGWLARIHYLSGEQTAAGKIYLDELNRNGSNLSRETVLTSLRMTYGYDGGPELLAHLEEYFDTPEHAAFAIQMATNPHFDRAYARDEKKLHRAVTESQSYDRVNALLEKHSDLLKSNRGADALALLGMRTALRMGDPPAALKVAAMVPDDAAIRAEPDFDWMLASARFLSREYAAAEDPLLKLFKSSRSSNSQQAAAAYALCGVYQKNKNTVEQIHYALWLNAMVRKNDMYLSYPSGIGDQSVYWAVSGWDLDLLLDAEAPSRRWNRSSASIRMCPMSAWCGIRWRSGLPGRIGMKRRRRSIGGSMQGVARRECGKWLHSTRQRMELNKCRKPNTKWRSSLPTIRIESTSMTLCGVDFSGMCWSGPATAG